MRIKKFNETIENKSEKDILNHIRNIFKVLEDDNDVELHFSRNNIRDELSATITIQVHLGTEHLLEYSDNLDHLSNMSNGLSSVSNIFNELKHLIMQLESESDYTWKLDINDLNTYSRIELNIFTTLSFDKYDQTLTEWEIGDEDYEDWDDE